MRMNALLLAGALIVALSGPALACRGSTEYPETAQKILQSKLPAERKYELMAQLNRGDALHAEAHREGNIFKMGKAIVILDGIKDQLAE